jgi:XTP/dITP diphosphohydrolase
MPRLYLASNNAHKVQELSAMLATLDPPWQVASAKELSPAVSWVEDGDSFLANARIKAEVLRGLTSECVLADDSGLVVDILGGEPGVYSSRYAGRDGDDAANNLKLLRAIAGRPASDLNARFVCTLYFIEENGTGHEFTGTLEGRLTHHPAGEHGFGYDPLFVPSNPPAGWQGRTLAEMPASVKNAISHRAAAFKAWRQWLARR